MSLKIVTTPKDQALFKMFAENNARPHREVAQEIAARYGVDATHPIVDDIHHAMEDASMIGVKMGRILA